MVGASSLKQLICRRYYLICYFLTSQILRRHSNFLFETPSHAVEYGARVRVYAMFAPEATVGYTRCSNTVCSVCVFPAHVHWLVVEPMAGEQLLA